MALYQEYYKEPITASGGWVCSDCGTFVPTGSIHACGQDFFGVVKSSSVTISDVSKEDQIIALLERILKVLERA